MGVLHATLVSVQGDRLDAVCVKLRLSQRDLAAECGVSQPTVSRIIAGRHRVSYDVFEKLCVGIARVGECREPEVAAFLLGNSPNLHLFAHNGS